MKTRLFTQTRILILTAVSLTTGCNRDVVEPCWTCTSFITYSYTGHPTSSVPPSPYTLENEICDEKDKVIAEKGKTETAFTIGGTSLVKTYQTVCAKKAKR